MFGIEFLDCLGDLSVLMICLLFSVFFVSEKSNFGDFNHLDLKSVSGDFQHSEVVKEAKKASVFVA